MSLTNGNSVEQDITSITVRNVAPTYADLERVYRCDTEVVTGTWDTPVGVPLLNRLSQLAG